MIYASEVHCLRVKTTNTTNPHWKKHSAEKKKYTYICIYKHTQKQSHESNQSGTPLLGNLRTTSQTHHDIDQKTLETKGNAQEGKISKIEREQTTAHSSYTHQI